MQKIIQAIIIVVAVALCGPVVAGSTTPAETAGLCAANAVIVAKAAKDLGMYELEQAALKQLTYLYNRYSNVYGFKEASIWQLKQQLTMQQRLTIADNCNNQGL